MNAVIVLFGIGEFICGFMAGWAYTKIRTKEER